ncbi:tRNA-uridine aminocarboxypropyltransferase [Massilia sp. TN1-12]|uniref:tRNA-uridine aminocarboxypropyltransferase n=1 Tax=Massilia paldalensis TaxID=3377675 RepID=UPI0038516AE9
MTIPSISHRRATCVACLRAQSDCICRWAAPVDAAVELLVLQHPLEVRNAKNSARLLHLCLPGSRLAVGEAFDADELARLLEESGKTPILLYPDTPGDAARGIAPPPALDEALLAQPSLLRLVVLDGTWRKSRKMLYLNPALQRLPRLALRDVPPSGYRIRKAHAPHQLSTLEAAAHALGQIDNDPARYRPLLAAFDGFVQQQAAKTPHLNPS